MCDISSTYPVGMLQYVWDMTSAIWLNVHVNQAISVTQNKSCLIYSMLNFMLKPNTWIVHI